jgi:glycosyltransferase involved in cell wall biosynthesis
MDVPVLGYVIRMFPQVSETFIANEIVSLERLGVRLRIYSYRRPQEDVQHECVRLIKSPITYLPDPIQAHLSELLLAQVRMARTKPAGYSAALRHVAGASIADRSTGPWKRLLQAGYLAQLLEGSNVERLHAHFAHGSTHVAMIASILSGLPFSFSAHARDIYCNDSPRLLREKIAAADFVVTCTQANQHHLRDMAASDGEKIQLGYHGVNVEKFSRPSRVGEDDAVPVILSVGRLVEKKGFGDLLQACRLMKHRGLTFRCVIIGEGPLRPRLERRVAALGIGDIVSLPGACTQEDLVEHYRHATVLVLACKVLANGDRDGIPNVLLEAMASGLPVVSTSVSGIPELIESGETGLLVRPESRSELAAAIELLIRDRGLRERLATRARAEVEERFDTRERARVLAGMFGIKGSTEVVA